MLTLIARSRIHRAGVHRKMLHGPQHLPAFASGPVMCSLEARALQNNQRLARTPVKTMSHKNTATKATYIERTKAVSWDKPPLPPSDCATSPAKACRVIMVLPVRLSITTMSAKASSLYERRCRACITELGGKNFRGPGLSINITAERLRRASLGGRAPGSGARAGVPVSSNASLNCALVIGTENNLNVVAMLLSCSSCDIAAQQSVIVKTLYPSSYPVRIVLSTQTLVSRPQIAKLVTPRRCKMSSRSVPAKASRPCFPLTIASCAPSMPSSGARRCKGAMDAKKSAPCSWNAFAVDTLYSTPYFSALSWYSLQ
mmetsp:Transcript_68537/g.210133  ORF Transcript_68537/g.210133 Transcript_68537/m.210133 type:complete len:315 (+) Transcript_68537:297-1241(+)